VISVSDICLGPPLDQAPPRSKLVRDPRSFGYRRLLPFLNELTKNGNILSVSTRFVVWSGLYFMFLRYLSARPCLGGSDSSIGKEVFPQDTAAHSKDVLGGSDSRLADEAIGVSHCEPEAMVVNTGGDTDVKDACNNVSEEIKIAPHDLTNKPVSLIVEHLRALLFLLAVHGSRIWFSRGFLLAV
jgi:hypothetical protein